MSVLDAYFVSKCFVMMSVNAIALGVCLPAYLASR